MTAILRLFIAALMLVFVVPTWAADKKAISISDKYTITTYPESKISTLTPPEGLTERIEKRTATSKWYSKRPGSLKNVVHCYDPNMPIHYKDDYEKDTEWKEIDPTYSEDKGTYIEFNKMPYTVKVWKNKYGYEITDRRTKETMSAELLEVDDTALGLASAKLVNVDFDVHVQHNGVRLWKHIKTDGPKKFKWKITDKADKKSELTFRLAPEAIDSTSQEPVIVTTSKEDISGGFLWTETVDKSGVSIDTDFTGQTSSGRIYGNSSSYATARATSTSDSTAYIIPSIRFVSPTYYVYRGFLDFDTSSLTGLTVTQVNLRMVITNNYIVSATYDVQIVKQTWVEPLADSREADFDGCLAGTADDNIWKTIDSSTAEDTQFTSGNLNTAYVNTSGDTKYSLRSSRDFNNNTPTNDERVLIGIPSDATVAYRPVLIVTAVSGWTGKIFGVTNPGKIWGVDVSTINKVVGVE